MNPLKEGEEVQMRGTFKSIAKEVVIFAFIAFGIVLPFRLYVAEPYIVDGASMDPTFKTGDYLIVDKVSYHFKNPERNSVIVFKFPGNTDKNFIKRIIGLPGETVILNGDSVKIINDQNPEGFVIDQSYIVHKSPGILEKKLKKGEYFVMGDNRGESYDSRSWGVLPKEDILGQPVLRLFPVKTIGTFPGNYSK